MVDACGVHRVLLHPTNYKFYTHGQQILATYAPVNTDWIIGLDLWIPIIKSAENYVLHAVATSISSI